MAKIQRSALALLLTLVSASSREMNTMSATASFVPTPPSTFQPNNLIHSCQERNAMTLFSLFPARGTEAPVEHTNEKQPHNKKKKRLFGAILANGPLLTLSSTAAHAAAAMKRLDRMPGGGGNILLAKPLSSSTSLGNPRPGLALVVVALFIAAALLRSAGEGAEYYWELWRGIHGLGGVEKEDDGEERGDAAVGVDKATKMVPYNFYDDAEAVGSTNWDSYKDAVLSPWGRRNLSKKGGWMRGLGKWVLNLMRIHEDIQSERETPAAKQKANEIFRQKQYEQHHHVIHAPTTTSATSTERGTTNGPSSVTASYLNSLHRFSSSVDDDGTISGTSSHGQVLVENEGEKYLDSLSLAKYPKSTWSNYKDNYLSKPSAKLDYESNYSDDEVNELKQEVSTLQDLMQLEQTMYQTSNYALKLAMDAQMQELERLDSINNGNVDNDSGDSIDEQLKAFDEKAKQFQETVDLPTLEDSKEANWFI